MTPRRWAVACWPAAWAWQATPDPAAAPAVACMVGCVSLALDAWSTRP